MSGPEKISSTDQQTKEEFLEVSEQDEKKLDKVSPQELSLQLRDVETPEIFDLSENMQKLGDINLSSQERNTLAESTLNKVLTSPTLLAQYLPYIKADSLRYLGSDTSTQIKLYNILVGSPSCRTIAIEGSQVQKDLMASRLAIDSKNNISLNQQLKDLSNQAQEKVKDFFNEFGSALLSIASLLGGKDALKKFCATFHLNLDSNIDALYKSTYMIESKKLQDIHDNFSGTTNDIQPYYSSEKRLDLNFGSLDPMLIDRANKSSLNIPDLILPDSTLYGEATYKINLNIALTYQQKTNLVSQIFKDPTLWKTVNALNNPNNPDALYGKDTPNRIETWYKKCPDAQEPKELAVAVGAYLMKGSKDLKQVLNESNLPYEEAHTSKRKEQHPEKTDANPDKSADPTEVIKTSWNSFFADLDSTGKRKDYPLTGVKESELDTTKKADYTNYKKVISEKISTLVDLNKLDFSSLNQDPTLKAKLTPFLTKHFTIYLKSLKDNTAIYTDTNKKAIEPLITKFETITTGLSVSLNDEGKLFIAGKDSTKPTPKEIKIEPTEFSWLPKKEEVKS